MDRTTATPPARVHDGTLLEPAGRGAGTIADAVLRRLFEASVIGIVISNNHGSIVQANDAFLAMVGYTRAELERGEIDWRALTPPEWLPLDERAIAEMSVRGSFGQYEKEYFRRDGVRVPISLGGARIPGSDDEQICYIVDLSQMRRTEAALRRSEARFKRLADAEVLGIMISRLADHAIVEANDEFLRMLGHTRDSFASGTITWTEITPPECRLVSQRARADLLATGRFIPYEKSYYRRDGSRVHVLVGGAYLDETNGEIITYVLDLSEQHAALQRVAESERRYRILADALPQIVMLSNSARQIVYVNRHYEAYTGISTSDVGAGWPAAIHPDDRASVDAARATGQPYQIEYRLRRHDGMYRWHFARVMPVAGEDEGSGWLAAVIDIDDRKRAEDALRFIEHAASVLSESLDLQTTFQTVLDLVVPAFGDWATLTLRDDDGAIVTVAARHKDPAKASLVGAFAGIKLFEETATTGTPAVYHTGRPQVLENMSAADLESVVRPPYRATVKALGYGSLIALPIMSGATVAGSFSIVSSSPNAYTDADLRPLSELARRASFAIENARRYDREHRVADSLQAAALPHRLPHVPGFQFDAYYRAGRQEATIGGDWYDAVVTPDGGLVISVGDVAGSGLRAAVLMGNVRQVLRAAAHVHADPTLILDVADRTLRSEHDGAMITAFVGVIDPVRLTMTYASAGHAPALLRAPGGDVTELAAPGLPLGCRHLAPGENRSAVLSAGARLVLYTDGLVEWSRNYLVGEALLIRRIREGMDVAETAPARALVERVLHGASLQDDVAVLVVDVDADDARDG